MSDEKVHSEEFRVNGEDLIARIKNLIKEGNIRKIIIKDKEGKTVLEIPMTFGVVGAKAGHLQKDGAQLPRHSEMYVDVGARSAASGPASITWNCAVDCVELSRGFSGDHRSVPGVSPAARTSRLSCLSYQLASPPDSGTVVIR